MQDLIEQFDMADVFDFKQNIDKIVPSLENINACTKQISNLFEKAAKESLKSIKRLPNKRSLVWTSMQSDARRIS